MMDRCWRIRREEDVLDDVVGPMVNKRVLIRGHRESEHSPTLHLDDVELDDEVDSEPTP
jgi:hypothetical protein